MIPWTILASARFTVDNSSSPGAVAGTSVLLIKFVRADVAKKGTGWTRVERERERGGMKET